MPIGINHVFQLEEIQKCFRRAHFTGAPILCCTFTCHLFQSSRQPKVLNVQPGNWTSDTINNFLYLARKRTEIRSWVYQSPGSRHFYFPCPFSSAFHSMGELLSFLFLCSVIWSWFTEYFYLFIWLFPVWIVAYAIFIAACRNSLWPSGSLVMAHRLQSTWVQ